MSKEVDRKQRRQVRHDRLRQRVRGTAARPRMSVMVSNRNMYVQFIDDDRQVTLASASSMKVGGGNATVARAKTLGKAAAEAALAAGIQRVVVDRGGFRFHGRVKALVDGAVEAGLQIRSKPTAASAGATELDAGKEES